MFRVLLIASLLCGCSTFSKYKNMKKPKIKLQNVSVQDTNLKGAKLLFGIMVDNPNDFALKVDSVEYDVHLGERKMTTEAINTPTEVAALSETIVKLPLTVQFADLFSSIGDFLRNDNIDYKIKGAAKIGILSLPFEETGSVKLKDGEIQHINK